jgi:hypothetical protein
MEGVKLEETFGHRASARLIEEGVWWDKDEEERAWEDDLWPWLDCL